MEDGSIGGRKERRREEGIWDHVSHNNCIKDEGR